MPSLRLKALLTTAMGRGELLKVRPFKTRLSGRSAAESRLFVSTASGVPFCNKPTEIESIEAEMTKHLRSFLKPKKAILQRLGQVPRENGQIEEFKKLFDSF